MLEKKNPDSWKGQEVFKGEKVGRVKPLTRLINEGNLSVTVVMIGDFYLVRLTRRSWWTSIAD